MFHWELNEIDLKKEDWREIPDNLKALFLQNVALIWSMDFGISFEDALAEATQAYENGILESTYNSKYLPPTSDLAELPPRRNSLTEQIKEHYDNIST